MIIAIMGQVLSPQVNRGPQQAWGLCVPHPPQTCSGTFADLILDVRVSDGMSLCVGEVPGHFHNPTLVRIYSVLETGSESVTGLPRVTQWQGESPDEVAVALGQQGGALDEATAFWA